MGKEETHRRRQAGAKERWAHTGGTEKAFATHESPVGSEKKSRRAKIRHEAGLALFKVWSVVGESTVGSIIQ